ncbi:MAG TPA: CHASE2 domain-containing protein, partial [Anaerolineae bacterium]
MSHIPKQIAKRLVTKLNNRRMHNRFQVGAVLALVTGLLLSTLSLSNLFKSYQTRLSDFFYRPAPPSGQVILVQIDDASLTEIGPWPWSRGTLANLLGTLARARPGAVAFDILLLDSTFDDAALAQVFQSLPNLSQPVAGVNTSRILPSLLTFPLFDSALTPAPALLTANTRLGHDMVVADNDQVVRRVPIAIQAAGRRYVALGIVALSSSRPALVPPPEGSATANLITQLLEDGHGDMYVNFTKWDNRYVISAADLLRGRVNPERVQDKTIFIGLTGSAATESYETPVTFEGQRAYPIEIQADLAETLVTGRLLFEQDGLTQITMIFLMAILAGATLPHFRFLSAAGLTILYFLAYLVYAFDKFNSGIIVPPLYHALALLIMFVLSMTYRYYAEDRQRGRVEQLFRRTASSQVVEQVLSVFERDKLRLSGVRREITLLHVDLHCFSALTDVLSPEDLMATLDLYTLRIVEVVFHHAGLVVMQTGESIVAAWNLPLIQSDPARRAV